MTVMMTIARNMIYNDSGSVLTLKYSLATLPRSPWPADSTIGRVRLVGATGGGGRHLVGTPYTAVSVVDANRYHL